MFRSSINILHKPLGDLRNIALFLRTIGFQTERFLHRFLLLLIEKGASGSSSGNKISASIIFTSAHNAYTHTPV